MDISYTGRYTLVLLLAFERPNEVVQLVTGTLFLNFSNYFTYTRISTTSISGMHLKVGQIWSRKFMKILRYAMGNELIDTETLIIREANC